MDEPRSCSFCRADDIGCLTPPGTPLVAYRCHQCDRVFYTADYIKVEVYRDLVLPEPAKRWRKSSIH